MSNPGMLSQDEIDALLRASKDSPGEVDSQEEKEVALSAEQYERPIPLVATTPALDLTSEEKDALGEIGNISMGSAATTLSELLRQKVSISSPYVTVCLQEEFFAKFTIPYIVITIEYKAGLAGFNVLVVKARDAAVIADLMMGGDGTNPASEIKEIELSATSEAMNQMIGTACTSMSDMFGCQVNIAPPVVRVLEGEKGFVEHRLPIEDPIVVAYFKMTVGDLLDTEIMQIMSLETAKHEAGLLLEKVKARPKVEETPPAQEQKHPPESGESPRIFGQAELLEGGQTTTLAPEDISSPVWGDFVGGPDLKQKEDFFDGKITASGKGSVITEAEQKRLELLLDIPLKVRIILGRAKRPIKEVLKLTPGAIVELSSQVSDPVEIMVNGTLIARGEVVVVNENFGVRVTSIISPQDRIQQLREAF